MLKQVEFLITGYLLPPSIGRLQISERLILEKVRGIHDYARNDVEARAYVAIEDEPSFFQNASSYLDFFILVHSLTNFSSLSYSIGPAIELSNLDDLGKESVSGYEKVIVLNESIESPFCKPILSAKERFLQLEANRQKIMDEYLGLALRYYYYTARANNLQRIGELIINLSISAEALFSTGRDFKTNLKYRLSTFIADSEQERDEISQRIGDFYDLRSVIVHGRMRKKNIPVEVIYPSNYIKRAIDKAFNLKLYTKKELLQYIEP